MVSKLPSLGLLYAVSMTLVYTVIYSLVFPSQRSPLMATLSKISTLVILLSPCSSFYLIVYRVSIYLHISIVIVKM